MLDGSLRDAERLELAAATAATAAAALIMTVGEDERSSKAEAVSRQSALAVFQTTLRK
jgi:hypothetical protein